MDSNKVSNLFSYFILKTCGGLERSDLDYWLT